MGVTNKDQCREAFEEHYCPDASAEERARVFRLWPDGRYLNSYTQARYEGWQAARSTPSAPLSDEQIDALPIVIRLRERIKYWKRESATANVWRQAIDRELVSSHLGVAGNDATQEQAGAALHELICWHVSVATDPATNGGKTLAYAPSTLELPEPDAYLFQHEDTGRTMFVDAQQVEWGFEANNPRLKKISGVYTEQQVLELLAAVRGGGVLPVGWVAVPVVPTNVMLGAAYPIRRNGGSNLDVWNAMLAAAPKEQG